MPARFLVAFGAAVAASAQSCPESPAWYARQGYIVREVRVEPGLPALPPAARRMREWATRLPVRAGQAFDPGDWQASTHVLQAAHAPDGGAARFSVRLIIPTILRCDAASLRLSVLYRVFLVEWPPRFLQEPAVPAWIRPLARRAPTILFSRAAVPAPTGWSALDPVCKLPALSAPLAQWTDANAGIKVGAQRSSCGVFKLRATAELARPALAGSYAVAALPSPVHEVDFQVRGSLRSTHYQARVAAALPRYAAGLDVSAWRPVWRRPLVPEAVGRDPATRSAIDFALGSAQALFADALLADTAAWRELAALLGSLDHALQPLESFPAEEIRRRAARLRARLRPRGGAPISPSALRGLVVDLPGAGSGEAGVPSPLSSLILSLDEAGASDPEAHRSRSELESLRHALGEGLGRLFSSPEARAAAQNAEREMAVARHWIRDLLTKTDAVALSPWGALSAARPGGVRIALGARATILMADVTLGYAVGTAAPHSAARPRFVFSVELSSLFR